MIQVHLFVGNVLWSIVHISVSENAGLISGGLFPAEFLEAFQEEDEEGSI